MPSGGDRRRPSDEKVRETLRAARQSEVALGTLLELYRPYLLAVARREMDSNIQEKGNPSDLVQQTYVIATRRFAKFEGSEAPQIRAWLRRILIHRIEHWHRRYRDTEKRDTRREQPLDDADSRQHLFLISARQSDTPGTRLHRKQESERVRAALGELSEVHRQIIIWRDIEGLSWDDIAAKLDRSYDAVRKLWSRAIQTLRSRLRDRNGTSKSD